jgi:hypothetical protein
VRNRTPIGGPRARACDTGGVEPHEVLGVAVDASREEIAAAYRDLAKRFHPDRAGTAAATHKMAEVNAAKDLLMQRLDGGGMVGTPGYPSGAGPAAARPDAPPRPAAGSWLPPEVRRKLARELLAALRPQEEVLLVLNTVTTDSHEVQLACTDQRLLWLRDDAITGRVRTLAYDRIASVEPRRARLRGTGELRVRATNGRRLTFSELRPRALDALVVTLLRLAPAA